MSKIVHHSRSEKKTKFFSNRSIATLTELSKYHFTFLFENNSACTNTTLFQSDENLYILFASQAPSCSSWWHLRPRWALLKLNNNWYDLLINVWSKYVHDVHVFHGMMMYIVQVLGWNDRLFWCLVLIWKKNQNIELPFWFSTSVVMTLLMNYYYIVDKLNWTLDFESNFGKCQIR